VRVQINMTNDGGLSDRDAVIDALVRFVMGLDDADSEMLLSSMTPEAVLDLTHFNQLGMTFELMKGRENVAEHLLKGVGRLDCTHCLSNFRVALDGDRADLTCYVMAQHFRPGEGISNKDCPWYMMGNRYVAEVVRSGGLWRLNRLVVKASWTTGNIGVLK
jgi:hypothetical protein